MNRAFTPPTPNRSRHRRACIVALMAGVIAAAGCHQDMYDQVKYEPLERSTFFPDGLSSRPLEPGVVPRGSLEENDLIATGRDGKDFVAEMPVPLSRDLLVRGQERFTIYCTPCHGQAGYGDGMIVQRGFRRPPSYHTDALRGIADGRIFDVVSNGFGSMPRFRDRIAVADRWAIVAYVRALQLSQNASPDDLTPARRTSLEQSAGAPAKSGKVVAPGGAP